MAADWIAIRIGIGEDPDVIAIACDIDRTEFEVVGMLVRFWSWADQNVTPECEKSDAHSVTVSVTKKWIDRHVGVTGFSDAMERRGWLEDTGAGLRIPRFGRYMGKCGKKRLQTARRNASKRNRDAKSDAASVTKASRTASPTEEKRREDIKERGDAPAAEKFDPLSVELPAALDTADFREAWSAWIAYRKRSRKALTADAVALQLPDMAAHGAAASIAAINDSIRNQWTGVFPGKQRPNGRQTATASGAKYDPNNTGFGD